jgi:5-(carboxyamino)imidazole ribonucleotide synthase
MSKIRIDMAKHRKQSRQNVPSKPGQIASARSPLRALGILGGGQLARMMVLRAHSLGLDVAVLSQNADDPAALVTRNWVQGSTSDPRCLRAFLKNCRVVTFESEFLDAKLLSHLARETKTQIFPKPAHMAQIQDRLSQKKLLVQHQLPTSDFFAVSTPAQAREAFDAFGGRTVFKKRRFGYDGNGTSVVRTESELTRFLVQLTTDSHGYIAEEFIDFQRELAVMVLGQRKLPRSSKPASLRLPFVETYQQDSRCLWVKGPLPEPTALKNLGRSLQNLVEEIGYCGILGIELFETQGGRYLINELAPRVHNSAHYSLDALTEDQFSLHMAAVLGLATPEPKLIAPAFAMWNLLGTRQDAPAEPTHLLSGLHWYGKSENRPGRKMGHLNALGNSPDQALKAARQAGQRASSELRL